MMYLCYMHAVPGRMLRRPRPPRRCLARWRLLVALPEPVEGRLGDLTPAVINRERVGAVRELPQVRDGRGLVVELPGRRGDRRRDRVVAAPGDQQQRAPVLVARV